MSELSELVAEIKQLRTVIEAQEQTLLSELVAEIKQLREVIEAQEQLLRGYRIGKKPPDSAFDVMEKWRHRDEVDESTACTDAEHDFDEENGWCRRCGAVGPLAYQISKEGQSK